MIILNNKKLVKAAIAGVSGVGAAYIGTGLLLYSVLLSKRHVNKDITERVLSVDEKAKFAQDGIGEDYGAWFVMIEPEEYRLRSSHGEILHAEVIKQKTESHKWVFIGHGWTNHPSGMSHFAKHFYDMGFNVLLPYLGGHEKSEKKFVSMGLADRLDIIDWANYITMLDPDAKICLHGVSMGAATMMMTAGEENLPSSVKCVIEDCGFTTLYDMGMSIVDTSLHIPPTFPISAANTVTRVLNGYTLREVSPIDKIRNSKVPVLFIHGEDDNFVPFRMCGELYDTARCEKQMLTVPQANHTEASLKQPDKYWSAVKEFTDKYLK